MGGNWRKSVRLFIAIGFLVCGLFAAATVRAQDTTTSFEEIVWFEWNGLFTECAGNCGVAGFGGGYIETLGLDLLGEFGDLPLVDWDWGDGGLLALSGSKRIATLAGVLVIEPEVGIAKRLGNMSEWEFWTALWFRWTWFPWNKYVITTFGYSSGLNFATAVSSEEKFLSGNGEGNKLLHYLSSEVTLALPEYPEWELIFRFHHRSGAYRFKVLRPLSRAIFNSTYGGAHYMTMGVRKRF